MKKFILVFSVMCSAFILSAQQDDCNATVTASKLNVRIKPSIKSPRAGVLVKGERVKVTGEQGFWAELEAPASLKFYVSEVYLVNGKLTNAVNLRTARDAKSLSFGLLPAGTKLEILEEASKHGWIQVKAPAGTKVYAFKEYLAFDAASSAAKEVKEADPAPEKAAEKKAEEKKADDKKIEEFIEAPKPAEEKKAAAPTPVKKVEEKKEAAPAPAKKAEEKKEVAPAPAKKVEEKKAEVKRSVVPAGKIESDLESLGAKFEKDGVIVKGVLYKIPKSTSPATNYAVLRGGENLGFVCGLEDAEFAKSVSLEVIYTGKSYRISGWKAPIIVVSE